ncbi:MAG: galactokinase, partial [Ornithinimicrobium sp.]
MTSTVRPDWLEPAGPGEHAASVGDAFTTAFGAPPDGVWAAPGRVNLIGEHLDYNGGPVLPIAIGHRTMVAAGTRPDRQVRLRSVQERATWQGSLDELHPDGMPSWCRYAAGVLWALGQAGHALPGLDLMVDGRVPSGAGLSSSAALTCAVAVAAADLAGIGQVSVLDVGVPDGGAGSGEVRARMLAEVCVRAENDFAGAPTGGMDQAVVLRAQAGHALLLDCTTFAAEHIAIPSGAEFLVVDTRSHHALTDGQYGSRRSACEQAAGDLGVSRLADIHPAELVDVLSRVSTQELRGVVRHVVTETARVTEVATQLRAGRLSEIGPMLTSSHASMRDDFVISTPELDLVVDSAMRADALGARMTGGGFGGSAVVLCRSGDRERVAECIAVAFEEAGWGP